MQRIVVVAAKARFAFRSQARSLSITLAVDDDDSRSEPYPTAHRNPATKVRKKVCMEAAAVERSSHHGLLVVIEIE